MVFIKILRPWQWAKNILIFFPFLLSGMYTSQGFIDCLVVFLLFSFLASGNYIFNDETYVGTRKYGLTTGTYTFVNDLSNHPLALLNVGNTNNITYTPESNTNNPIIIKVSGGSETPDANDDYYTFTDASNNPISIDNSSFRFMRGVTYRFSIDSTTNTNHPRSCYIESKRGGETILNNYKSKIKFKPISIRLCLGFGPGVRKDDERVLHQFIEKALKFNKIQIRPHPSENLLKFSNKLEVQVML